MRIEYTPEEVRTLIEKHEALDYPAPTADDIAEATDVLEGVEELIARLDPAIRRETVDPYGIPVGAEGGRAWIPVANNCSRSAGVTVSLDGTLSFAVRSEAGELASYFAARQAVAHALAGADAEADADAEPDADCSIIEQSPRTENVEHTGQEDPLVTLLKENGWVVACGRTLADVDDEVLARAYKLSEEGIAHLFATEAGDGIVLAMAGSTAGDRIRAVEALPKLPDRSYSSRPHSVLFDCGETGEHYSEQEGFGQTIKEAPKPKESLLEAAAERFKAARFVRPSSQEPLDTEAIRRYVRKLALVRAAVRAALAVDPADAGELVRRVAVLYLIGRYMSRKTVRRTLAAEKPWDSKAERRRMLERGLRLRGEIVATRKERGGKAPAVTPARELDDQRAKQSGRSEAHWADSPKLRRAIARRQGSGRAAYDTVRAVYLQRCPELEHKLLHLLRRDGVKAEAAFLSCHSNLAAEATNPEGALRAALRRLAEAGKVRRVRSHKTGEVFLTATEPLDETGYRRSLNGLIRRARFGIVNPWSDASAVEAEGEAGEWEKGLEDLDSHEAATLVPKRFRNTEAPEQQLVAAEAVADYNAHLEIEVVAEEIAEGVA